jgi:hypothetical protein
MNHSHNLTRPLAQVTASYRSARPRPARRVAITRRADQLAAWVTLSLDEPSALKNLQDEAAELRELPQLSDALPRVATGAMTLLGAEFCNIQFVDPRDDSLVLVTQSGFRREFLDHFAVVHNDHSVCGRAAWQGKQAVAADVRDDPVLVTHQKVFHAAGVRSVQSTPLVDHTGQLIGIISTHMSQPGLPSDQDLQIMEIYAQLAGEAIARHLAGDGVGGRPAGLACNGTTREQRLALLGGGRRRRPGDAVGVSGGRAVRHRRMAHLRHPPQPVARKRHGLRREPGRRVHRGPRRRRAEGRMGHPWCSGHGTRPRARLAQLGRHQP